MGHCPHRRWFRLAFGSGFNTTTATAGKLRGCQHVMGLRVRAESVPGFLSGGGDPPPVRAGVVCGPPHVLGRAAAFQLPTRVAGMHSLGFVLCCLQCSQADRFTQLPGRPITVTTLILLCAYISCHFPARDAIMLLAAIFSTFFGLLHSAGILIPLSASL